MNKYALIMLAVLLCINLAYSFEPAKLSDNPADYLIYDDADDNRFAWDTITAGCAMYDGNRSYSGAKSISFTRGNPTCSTWLKENIADTSNISCFFRLLIPSAEGVANWNINLVDTADDNPRAMWYVTNRVLYTHNDAGTLVAASRDSWNNMTLSWNGAIANQSINNSFYTKDQNDENVLEFQVRISGTAATAKDAYIDDLRCWTGSLEDYPPLTPTPMASFDSPPTPASGLHINTLAQNISISCTNSGTADIYFGKTYPPIIHVSQSAGNSTYWITNSSVMDESTIYYYFGRCSNLTASDTEIRNITYDAINPEISYIYPSDGNTSTSVVNATVSLQVNATDENLFAAECLVYNPSSALMHNFSYSDLSGEYKYINESILLNATGEWTVRCEASDDHTAAMLIDEYKPEIEDKILNFSVSRLEGLKLIKNPVIIEYASPYTLESTKTLQGADRYSWEYDIYLGDLKFEKEITHEFRLQCGGAYARLQYDFPSFVCWDSRQWVDFNTPGIIAYNVYECGDGCFDVIMKTKPSEKLVFSSIGGLNIVQKDAIITVTAAPQPKGEYVQYGTCPTDSLQETIMFIFMFVVGVFLIFIVKSYVGMPGVTMIFSIVIGSFLGLMVMSCSPLLGSLMIIIGIGFAIAEFMS